MIPRLEIRFSLKQQLYFLFGKEYRPNENEFLLNHARSGIIIALQSLHLEHGSRVGVMTYNCHTVFNAIAQAGFEMVFIDISDGLTIDIDHLREKVSNLSALVVSHLFGIENDLAAIKSEFPNLPVIEDCAHAYGKSHSIGDFAVYSIGQGKFPSLGPGGILVVNNNCYLNKVGDLYSRIPSYNMIQSFGLFFRLLAKAFLYIPLVYTLLTEPLKSKRKGSHFSSDRMSIKTMSKGVSRMLSNSQKDTPIAISQRVERAERLKRSLDSFPHLEDIRYGANAFMLVVRSDDVSSLKEFFLSKGIETATHFSHCIDWAIEYGYELGSCPNSERLVNCLLMIPTYQ